MELSHDRLSPTFLTLKLPEILSYGYFSYTSLSSMQSLVSRENKILPCQTTTWDFTGIDFTILAMQSNLSSLTSRGQYKPTSQKYELH